jgi:hypothetical protein
MNIEIIEHNHPKLKIPECVCDNELNPVLNNYELLKIAFNKQSSATLIIGKPGQGKTTFVQSLFSNRKALRGKYSKIYLFCPPRSRDSMLDGALNQLDEERIYDELNYDNLNEVIEMCKEDNNNDCKTKLKFCLIFDDMGAYLKNKNTMKLFNELMMNRRHMRISVIFLVQTFYSVSREMRRLFTNFFIFKVNKRALMEIFDEILEEQNKDLINEVARLVYDRPHTFLYINSDNGRLFKNWDEILIKED